MSWRIAESLEVLRRQLNVAYPNRSKVSDGGIGNAEHAARTSDHNPWVKDSRGQGVVTARDFTFDDNPSDGIGIDGQSLVDCLVANRDPRIKYIIWNRRIISSKSSPWIWRSYGGTNAHKHHVHISVSPIEKLFDDDRPWNLDQLTPKPFKNLKESEIILEIPVSAVSSSPLPTLGRLPGSLPKEEQPPLNLQGASETSGKAEQLEAEQKQVETQLPAPEQATEQTQATTPQGETQIVKTLNEQDVNIPAEVAAPEPQGVAAKLKAGIGTIFGGTIIYTISEKFGAMSFSTQAIILLSVVAFIALLGFCFWAWLDAWKAQKKLALEVEAKTSINKKDLIWR